MVASPSPVASLSQQELSKQEPPVAPFSLWLRLMLAEIARKREELELARVEAARRASEDLTLL